MELNVKMNVSADSMDWIPNNVPQINNNNNNNYYKTCVMVIGSRANLKKIESFNVYINTTLL